MYIIPAYPCNRLAIHSLQDIHTCQCSTAIYSHFLMKDGWVALILSNFILCFYLQSPKVGPVALTFRCCQMWGGQNCLSFETAVGGIEPPSPRLTVRRSNARPPLTSGSDCFGYSICSTWMFWSARLQHDIESSVLPLN